MYDIGFPISIGINVVVLFAFFDNDEGLVGQRRACHADGLWVGGWWWMGDMMREAKEELQ